MANLKTVNTSPVVAKTSFKLIRENVNGAIKNLDENVKTVNNALPYIQCGTYQGDGQASKEISLGFKPTAVIVWAADGSQHDSSSSTVWDGGLALIGQPCEGFGDVHTVEITSNGFKVRYYEGSPNDYYRKYVNTNSKGTHYYIAFRNITREDYN